MIDLECKECSAVSFILIEQIFLMLLNIALPLKKLLHRNKASIIYVNKNHFTISQKSCQYKRSLSLNN